MEGRGGFNPNTLKKAAAGAGIGLLATGLASCSGSDLNRSAEWAKWEAGQTATAQGQMVESYHATQIAQGRVATSTPSPDYATDPVFCEEVESTVSEAADKARGNLPEGEAKDGNLWVGLNRDGSLHFSTMEDILTPSNNSEMNLTYRGDAVCVSLDYDALTEYMGGVFLAQP